MSSGALSARREARQHATVQARSERAVVARESLTSFFNALDVRHCSRVALEDLLAFTRRQRITFEFEEGDDGLAPPPNSNVMPLPSEQQHLQILAKMMHEAASLRAPALFAKEDTGMQQKQPTLERADLAAALALRPALAQSPRGSEVSVLSRSGSTNRARWIRLLRCVVPQPFEPQQFDVREGTGQLSARLHNDEPLPRSMYEREAEHAAQKRAAYIAKRDSSPAASNGALPYNPTIMLHDPPTARSSAESYRFTQPTVRAQTLPVEYVSQRAERDRAQQEQRERERNPKQKKLQQLASALATTAREYEFAQMQQQHERERERGLFRGRRTDDDDEDEDDALVNPYASLSVDAALLQSHQSDDLDAGRLGCITFRTRAEFDARRVAALLKSDALDWKEDAHKHSVDNNGDDDDDGDDFTRRLMESLVSAQGGAAAAPKKPQGTARERVAKALAAQNKSVNTSGQFKPSARAASLAAQDLDVGDPAALIRLPDGSFRPRWHNADAPSASENAATAARLDALRRARDPLSAAAAVQYDDQGRPITTQRRRAMDARVLQTNITQAGGGGEAGGNTAAAASSEQRRQWDAEQAAVLSVETQRLLEAFPLPDPLDVLLAPFVLPEKMPHPLSALEQALEQVPATAGTMTRRITSAGAATAAASSVTDALTSPRGKPNVPRLNLPGSQTQRPASSSGGRKSAANGTASVAGASLSSPSSRTSRAPFTTHFSLPTPSDERRLASQNLTCFGALSSSLGTADAPTIANGGITTLAQLRPGYMAPSPQEQAKRVILDRDASAGDLSLLPRGSHLVAMHAARAKLRASRPEFRLDFVREAARTRGRNRGPASLGECDVITRDGGATTAAQSEAWRLQQLGFDLRRNRPKTAEEDEQNRAQTARLSHTRGRVVHTDHLRPGAHTARHSAPFSTLGATMGPSPPPLHVSEREALLRAQHRDAVRHNNLTSGLQQQQQQQRKDEQARLRPSERRKREAEAANAARYQQWPFTNNTQPLPTEHKVNS